MVCSVLGTEERIYQFCCVKNRVYYTTVDKWLRNYKAIGPEAFFEKGIPIELPAQKKPLF